MNCKLTTGQWILVGVAALFGGLLLGIVGLAVGVDYSARFCTTYGYEEAGRVGFFIAAPLGFVLSAWGARALLLRCNAWGNA